jgi:hypothetical protein
MQWPQGKKVEFATMRALKKLAASTPCIFANSAGQLKTLM